MKTIRRMALMIVSCGTLLALGHGTAWAEGETVVTYTGSPGAGSEIRVAAAPGKAKASVWLTKDSCSGTLTCIRDTAAGIVESSPHCSQASPTEVRCQTQGLRRLEVRLGGGPDGLRTVGWDYHQACTAVKTGPGNDRIVLGDVEPLACDNAEDFVFGFPIAFVLGPGNDKIFGHFPGPPSDHPAIRAGGGRDRIRVTGAAFADGGHANDVLRGGLGPQRFKGGRGNDAISCGKGKDLASGGPGRDTGGAGCEETFSLIGADQFPD